MDKPVKPPKGKYAICSPGFFDEEGDWVPAAIVLAPDSPNPEIRTADAATRFSGWFAEAELWLETESGAKSQRMKEAKR